LTKTQRSQSTFNENHPTLILCLFVTATQT